MNKNDIIKIARSLYLQQMIARQLFAKFDITKQLSQSNSSFGRLSQNLSSLFFGFVGSVQRTPFTQIVQKNGMKFKIYKLNIDNTRSNQIYKNTEYDIHNIFFVLRKLYVSMQKGGDFSFKNLPNVLQKKWYQPPTVMKNTDRRFKAIIEQLQSIKQVLISVNQLVIGDIDYIQIIRNLQSGIAKFIGNPDFALTEQFDKVSVDMQDFISNFKVFCSNKDNYLYAINRAVDTLKAFVTMYSEIKSQYESDSENQLLKDILSAMQNCNTNIQLEENLANMNIKEYVKKDYKQFKQQDLAINNFIRFIKHIDKNSKIQYDDLEKALNYYFNLDENILSEEAKKCLKQLQLKAEITKNEEKSPNQKYFMFKSDSIGQDLIRKINNIKEQLI